jgi:protein-disulfide isomerase/uncharacterized membrane protein
MQGSVFKSHLLARVSSVLPSSSAIGLCLFGLFVTISLTAAKYNGNDLPCGIRGCAEIQASSYSTIAGLPISLFGASGFGLILASYVFGSSDHGFGRLIGGPIRVSIALFGAFISGLLTLISLFQLQAHCSWCLLSSALYFALLGSVLLPVPRGNATAMRRSLRHLVVTLAMVSCVAGWTFGRIDHPLPLIDNSALGSVSAAELVSGHSIGSEKVPTVVAFVDLTCKACAKDYFILAKLADRGRIRLVIKHFPFVNEALSQYLALASERAAGEGQFWEFIESIFDSRITSVSDAERLVEASGIEVDYAGYARSPSFVAERGAVAKDVALASKLRIRGTPTTIFVESGHKPIALSVKEIKRKVDKT